MAERSIRNERKGILVALSVLAIIPLLNSLAAPHVVWARVVTVNHVNVVTANLHHAITDHYASFPSNDAGNEYVIEALSGTSQIDHTKQGSVTVAYQGGNYRVSLQNGWGIFTPSSSSPVLSPSALTVFPPFQPPSSYASSLSWWANMTSKADDTISRITDRFRLMYSTLLYAKSTALRNNWSQSVHQELMTLSDQPLDTLSESSLTHLESAVNQHFFLNHTPYSLTLHRNVVDGKASVTVRIQSNETITENAVEKSLIIQGNDTEGTIHSQIKDFASEIKSSIQDVRAYYGGHVDETNASLLDLNKTYGTTSENGLLRSIGLSDLSGALKWIDRASKGLLAISLGISAAQYVTARQNGNVNGEAQARNEGLTTLASYGVTEFAPNILLGLAEAIAPEALDAIGTLIGDGVGLAAGIIVGGIIASHPQTVGNAITNFFSGVLSLFGVYTGDEQNDTQIAYAPEIYLYPVKKELVTVKLQGPILLTASTPTYSKQGWRVVASPKGTMIEKGHAYSDLYYEDAVNEHWQWRYGWIVTASDFSVWAHHVLSNYGLSTTEMNAFIAYWRPKVETAKWWLFAPQPLPLINRAVRLQITPTPTSELRLWFAIKPLKNTIRVVPPKITSFRRKGFSVVEWGGVLTN